MSIESVLALGEVIGMDKDSALAFLKKHQPLPAELDEHLHDGLLQVWEFLRGYLCEDPDPVFVPLLLNVFGGGDAGGIYQRFEDLLEQYPREELVPHIAKQLECGRPAARYWAARFASGFPDERFVESLGRLFQEADSDLRAAAATALGQIHSRAAKAVLLKVLSEEVDPEVRDLIASALST